MALKGSSVSSPISAAQAAPRREPEVILQLALYTNYTVGGFTYVKDTAYRFSQARAIQLLSERDAERPVWKVYTPPPVKVQKTTEVVDATDVPVVTAPDLPPSGIPDPTARRIDVGSDVEIADVLARVEAEAAGNVQI